MMWQDYFFAFTGAVFGLVLIPSCLNEDTEIPRWSSVPTALLCAASVGVWGSLGMWASMGSSVVCAAAWIFLALARPVRPLEEIINEIPQFEVTLEEAQLIMEHREWIKRKQREAAGEPEPGEVPGCSAPDGCSDSS